MVYSSHSHMPGVVTNIGEEKKEVLWLQNRELYNYGGCIFTLTQKGPFSSLIHEAKCCRHNGLK